MNECAHVRLVGSGRFSSFLQENAGNARWVKRKGERLGQQQFGQFLVQGSLASRQWDVFHLFCRCLQLLNYLQLFQKFVSG